MASALGPLSLRGWAHPYAYITGESTAQTVSTVPTTLWRVIAANGAASVATVTVKDGSNTVGIYQIPANDTRQLDIEVDCATSLIVTPSAATLALTVLYG